jgi:hypothetical protein
LWISTPFDRDTTLLPLSLETTYCQAREYSADLRGRLKKLKNGKVIAELDAKFFYVHGC